MKEPDPGLIDHAIQKDIVRTLVRVSRAKYSELKPKRVESNLFMYHVNQLMKRNVVEKNKGVYSLTTLGSMYVDRANLDKLVFRIQPKIVSILVIKSDSGKWLLLQRQHEPHMGRIGFPSGKLHYGEDLLTSAHRELNEKAGFSAPKLKLAGSVAMRFMQKDTDEIINHTIGYVFTASLNDEPDVKNTSTHWKAYWGEETELLNGNVFKGHQEILTALATDKVFIESFDFVSDY